MGRIQQLRLACRRCNDEIIAGRSIGNGNDQATIMLVGQNPCYPKCLQYMRPFTGGSGRLVDDALKMLGLTRDDVFITNAVSCATYDNVQPSLSMRRNCQGFLFSEIEEIEPSIIVALGTVAFDSLVGRFVKKQLTYPEPGSVTDQWINFRLRKVLYVHHPAYYMRMGTGKEFLRQMEVLQEWI
ncbi:MAG: uracil-DNA glycosylase family protein [Methanosarcinales archaeon]